MTINHISFPEFIFLNADFLTPRAMRTEIIWNQIDYTQQNCNFPLHPVAMC